jgi:two-component system chemotaxis response regulator CheB
MGTLSDCSRPIRVFMIDDTAIVRETLSREIVRQNDIQLVGTAGSPFEAIRKISLLKPDVITLDIEMPQLDPSNFLARFISYPVIVLTSSTQQGAARAMEALSAGAVDVIYKPVTENSISEVATSLIEKVRAARGVTPTPLTERPVKMRSLTRLAPSTDAILAIGASAGSIESLDEVLSNFPSDSPGTIIVHHLPARLTSLLADRLNQVCDIEVKEAVNGDPILAGRALIAPGGRHMLLRRTGSHYFVQLKDGPEVCHQKPSVDVLFNSVAKVAGRSAIGAILSGSGSDGAQGLSNLRKVGGRTIVAADMVAQGFNFDVEKVVPLEQIADTMIELASLSPQASLAW